MSVRRLLGAGAFALLVLLGAAPRPAFAQAQLGDGTSPAEGETVQLPGPSELILVFTEPLEEPPRMVLQSSANTTIALGGIGRGDDAQIWIAPITAALAADTYKVTWTTTDSTGTYQFTVASTGTTETTAAGTGATAAGTATTAAGTESTGTTEPGTDATGGTGDAGGGAASTDDEGTDLARSLAVLARWISYLSLGAFAGALLLIVLAWPEGVEYVLTARHLRVSWIVALLSTAVLVMCTRAIDTGESLGSSLSPSSWTDLTDTRTGVALLARLVLVAACGWVAFRPERIIDAATQIPAAAAPALAIVTMGFSREGETSLGLLAVPAGVVHAAGYAAWFGGIVLLVRVVLAGPGDVDLVHALRGFSRIAAPALLAVVASGALQTARLVGGASNLLSTGYGRLLLLKALAVAAMAYIGTINRHTVVARLARLDHLPARAAMRMRRAVGSEVVAGVVVLGLSAWMMGSTPAGLTVSSSNSVRPTQTVPMTATGVGVTVGIGPSTVGENSVTIEVEEPAVGLVEMVVRLDPARGNASSIEIAVTPSLTGRGTLVVDGVPLGASGTWLVSVTSSGTNGSLPRLAGSFSVAAADGAEEPDGTSDTTTTVGTGLSG